jgi:hypothetical protein
MWKTKIADVVRKDFDKAENNARNKMGFTENVKRKNITSLTLRVFLTH